MMPVMMPHHVPVVLDEAPMQLDAGMPSGRPSPCARTRKQFMSLPADRALTCQASRSRHKWTGQT
jgi:hypothetical protein